MWEKLNQSKLTVLATLCEQPNGRKSTRLYKRPAELPAPSPPGHRSTLLAKGAQDLEGVWVLPSLHAKAVRSDREEVLRWIKQTKLSWNLCLFSPPITLLFTWKNYTEGKGGGMKKINPRVTTDVDTANTVLLEKVINLPPDACHRCVVQGL